MGRGRAEQALQNVLELRHVHPVDEDEQARLGRVMESLRDDAGPTVTKAVAARLLKVSRNTLDKWIQRGVISTRGRAIDRAVLEEIAVQIEQLRESGKSRALLVEALNRLEQEDPAWQQRVNDLYGAAGTDDEFVSAAPGDDWDAGD